MFKGLKQKIAQGHEGVSPGRQTPLQPKPEVGKAQAQNNGILEQNSLDTNENTSFSDPLGSNEKVITDVNATDEKQALLETKRNQADNNIDSQPIENAPSSSSTPIKSLPVTPVMTPQSPGSTFKQLKGKLGPLKQYLGGEDNSTPTATPDSTPLRSKLKLGFSALGLSTPVEEKSDAESEPDTSSKFDHLSRDDILIVVKKQSRVLTKYKSKFSEVVDSYKVLQKEKEKLENTLTTGQDKHLRRITELKEIVELEKKAKEHLEETLRMALEEKDEMIDVLHTQIQLLKKKDSGNTCIEGDQKDGETHQKPNQEIIEQQKAEIEKLKHQSKDAKEVILRLEAEKKTAITEMLSSVQSTAAENNDLKANIVLLKDEIKSKENEISAMISDSQKMRETLTKELKGAILEEAILRQEKEMHSIYQKKEEELKANFTEKVREVQQLVEEKELQKRDAVADRDKNMEMLKEKILGLEEELKSVSHKLTTSQNKTKKLVTEKEEWEKKFYEAKQKVDQEQARLAELVHQHNTQLKQKQEELQQQLSKSKKSATAKVHDLHDQLKKQEQKISEVQQSAKCDLEKHLKEAETAKQTEISKVAKTYDSKISDMKKAIKGVRSRLGEKEELVIELEGKLSNAAGECKSVRQNAQQMEKQIKLLEAQIAKKDDVIKSMNSEFDQQKKDIEKDIFQKSADFDEKEVTAKKTIEDLTFMLQSKEKQVTDLNQSMEEKEKQVEFVKNVSDKYEETILEFEKKLASAQLNIEQLENKNKELVNEKDAVVNQLTAEKENAVVSASKDMTSTINNHKLEISKLEEQHKNSVAQLHDEYQKGLKQMKEHLNEATEKINVCEALRKENELLKGDNTNLMEAKKSLEDTIKNLECAAKGKTDIVAKKCEEWKSKYAASQNEVQAVKSTLSTLTETKQTLEAELASLKEKLSNTIASMQTDLVSKETALSDLQSRHENRTRSLEEEVKRLVAQLQTLEEESKCNILKCKDESDKIYEKKMKEIIAQYDNKICQLKTEHKQEATQLEAEFEKKRIEKEKELKILEENNKKEENRLKNCYEEELRSLSEKVAAGKELSDNEAVLNSRIAFLTSEKEGLQNSLNQERATFNGKTQALEANIETLLSSHSKEMLDASMQHEDYMKTLVDKHATEIQALAIKCESMFNENTALNARNITLSDVASKLQIELDCALENVKASELKIANLSNDNLKIQQTVEEYTQRLGTQSTDMNAERNRIESELNTRLNDCNNSWKTKCDQLEKKYRKIIADKEKKRKDELDKCVQGSREQLAYLENSYEAKIACLTKEMETLKVDNETGTNALKVRVNVLTDEVTALNKKNSESNAKLEEALSLERAKVKELQAIAEDLRNKEKNFSSENKMSSQRSDKTEVSRLVEEHKKKLQEMKRKAESKIVSLNKNHAAAMEVKEQQLLELQRLVESHNHSNNVNEKDKKVNELDALTKQLHDKNVIVEDLNVSVKELTEKLENSVVDKMQALKTLETNLKDEHNVEIEKLRKESASRLDSSEQRLQAKIDEKEFEYSARVKQIVKEFQAKVDSKDLEIHEAVESAIDKGQKEEKRIIQEYEDQIMEYRRELKLRDDDMKNLKESTEEKLETMKQEMVQSQEKAKEELLELQTNYHNQIDELARRQETELQSLKNNHSVGVDDFKSRHEKQLIEIEESYHSKLKELESQHQNEILAMEKKFKVKLKKNNTEMKKLLADKGVIPPTKSNKMEDVDLGLQSNNSDTELDSALVASLKGKITALSREIEGLRERETQTNDSRSPMRNNRPATLDIHHTPNRAGASPHSSSPRTPEPVQYEYLRNVLFEYMMGRQKKQLSRVLAAIVHFSPSQIQQIADREDQVENSSAGLFG